MNYPKKEWPNISHLTINLFPLQVIEYAVGQDPIHEVCKDSVVPATHHCQQQVLWRATRCNVGGSLCIGECIINWIRVFAQHFNNSSLSLTARCHLYYRHGLLWHLLPGHGCSWKHSLRLLHHLLWICLRWKCPRWVAMVIITPGSPQQCSLSFQYEMRW